MYIPIWAIIVLIVIGYFYFRKSTIATDFSPFNILISFNWYELLKDYKLADNDIWKQLDEFYSKKLNGYNVFKYGISFTVLGLGGSPYLIYNNNRNSFHTEVDFREKIEGIKIPNKNFPSLPFSPQLWVKSGIEGYEIGITTPESHKKVIMVGDNNELIKITTLPYSLFHLSKYRFGLAKPKQIEEQLKKNGWSKDKTAEEYKIGVLLKMPEELKHKYFTVDCEYI